jgi:hypothetical protein
VEFPLAKGEERLEGNPHLTVIRHPTTGKVYTRKADDGSLDVMPPRTQEDVERLIRDNAAPDELPPSP